MRVPTPFLKKNMLVSVRCPPFLFPFSSKLRKREGFFILICIEKMYNHAIQGVPSYTDTSTAPSRVPIITLTVMILLWNMIIFGVLRAIMRIKDSGKALKLRIMWLSVLSFVAMMGITGGNQLLPTIVKYASTNEILLYCGIFLICEVLSFIIIRKWIISKMEISSTKKLWLSLGLVLLNLPTFFGIARFIDSLAYFH